MSINFTDLLPVVNFVQMVTLMKEPLTGFLCCSSCSKIYVCVRVSVMQSALTCIWRY